MLARLASRTERKLEVAAVVQETNWKAVVAAAGPRNLAGMQRGLTRTFFISKARL